MRIGSTETIARRDDGDARVEVDGKELDHKVHYNVFPNQSGRMIREFMFNDFQREVGSTRDALRLDVGRHGDLKLDVSGFQKALEASLNCLTDLHKSLKIDQAVLDAIVVKPEGMALRFVNYPKDGSGFDLALLYWVTPDGKIDECKVLVPSGYEKFDQTVCQQLKAKARFKPARNAAGEAIRAPVYDYIRLRRTSIITTGG